MADRRQRLIYDIVVQGAGALTADLKTIQTLLESHQKQAQVSGNAIVASISKQSQAVADLIRQQIALQTAANATATAQLAATQAATTSANAASAAASAQRAATQAATLAIQQQNAQYGAMKDQLTGLVGLAASVFSINAIRNYTMDVIDAKTKVDLFSVSLTTMIGNKKQADEVAGKIFEIAKRSPFEVEQLVTTTQRLKAMGVETQNLVPYIEALGNISSLVGTSRLPLIAKAMVDVQNKGKLMAQEIKQFTDNGVPLFDLLAKSMGKTREEVVKLAHDHKISFADVEKAILQASEKGGIYYNAMTNSAKTLGGQVSNLSDIFFLGKAKIGDYFENGLQKGISIMKNFLEATMGSNSAIARTTTALQGGLALWLSYRVAIIATNASLAANQQATLTSMGTQLTANTVTAVGTGLTTSLSNAFKGLWLAMSANPIGFIISGLGLAFSAFQLYEATVMNVTAVESEQVNMLNKTKIGFEANVKALINLKAGSEERRGQVALLQAQYPGYIRNIDLESASNNQLWGLLKKVNTEIERKIKLAVQDSYTQSIQEKAIALGRDQLKIIETLREKNKSYINGANLSNDEFIAKLKVVNATMSDRDGLNTFNRLGVETLAITQKEMTALTSKMSQSINETTKITRDNLKATQKDLLQNLSYQQKVLNENHTKEIEAAKGNKVKLAKIEADYKKDWNAGIAEYKKLRDEANGVEVKGAKDKDDAIVTNTGKANKKRAENHSLTAKEINLIEAQANAKRLDMSKELSKDELKVLKDLAKAEYEVDVEKLQKKFKTHKDGKEKISAEMIKLDLLYFNKLEKIDFDETKKRFSGVEILQNKHLTTKELNQKVSLDKQQKAEEKLNAKLADLTSDFLESQAKLEDAKRLQAELANAKSASERYAVMVKFGRRTNDELLAMSVARWKQEQAQLQINLKFAEVIYGKDSAQYKNAQEQNLVLSTKINNAMTTVITKQSDETIRAYDRLFKFYQKNLADSFKSTIETYDRLISFVQDHYQDQESILKTSFDLQSKALGNSFDEKMALSERFYAEQQRLIESSYKMTSAISSMKDFTTFMSNSFDSGLKTFQNYQQKKDLIQKEYDAKTAENLATGVSNEANAATMKMNKTLGIAGAIAQGVGIIMSGIVDMVAKQNAREIELYDKKYKIQEEKDTTWYATVLSRAKADHESRIALIKEEERILLQSLELQYAKKLDLLNANSYNINQALGKQTERELKLHEIKYRDLDRLVEEANAEEFRKLKEKQDKTLEEQERQLQLELDAIFNRIEVTKKTKASQVEIDDFYYKRAIEQAKGNQEEIKRINEEYAKANAERDAYWNKAVSDAEIAYYDAQVKYEKDLAEIRKANVSDSEKQKMELLAKIRLEAEEERLRMVEMKRREDLDNEKRNSSEKIATLVAETQTKETKQNEHYSKQLGFAKEQYDKEVAEAAGNSDKLKAAEDKYQKEKEFLANAHGNQMRNIRQEYNKKWNEEDERSKDENKIIQVKYDDWKKSKDKQQADERQEILDNAEKRRQETLATSQQNQLMAQQAHARAKGDLESTTAEKIAKVNINYQDWLFDFETVFNNQRLSSQEEYVKQHAEYAKKKIGTDLLSAAAGNLASGNFVGTLAGAFDALMNGSDYQVQIESNKQAALSAISQERNALNTRQRPKEELVTSNKYLKVVDVSTTEERLNIFNSGQNFKTTPLANLGHETPIDYEDVDGGRLAIYEWVANRQGNSTVYSPRFRRNFKDGSNYIDRGQHKQGIDTIPAMVNEGERILTTEQNQLIGGKTKPNQQLVKEVQFAEFVMKKMPNLMDMFQMPSLKMDMPGGTNFNDAKMLKGLESIEKAIANKKNTNVNVNVDKYKVSVEEHTEQGKTKYHNQIYNRNHRN